VSGPVLRETDPRVIEDLERILAPERVLTRPIDRLGRSADASIYRLIPQAIVRPHGVAEVRELFGWARQKHRHLTFRTAGTSCSSISLPYSDRRACSTTAGGSGPSPGSWAAT
jgi:hypothetical protein